MRTDQGDIEAADAVTVGHSVTVTPCQCVPFSKLTFNVQDLKLAIGLAEYQCRIGVVRTVQYYNLFDCQCLTSLHPEPEPKWHGWAFHSGIS